MKLLPTFYEEHATNIITRAKVLQIIELNEKKIIKNNKNDIINN